LLCGNAEIGAAALSVRLAQRLQGVLGEDSTEWAAIKLGEDRSEMARFAGLTLSLAVSSDRSREAGAPVDEIEITSTMIAAGAEVLWKNPFLKISAGWAETLTTEILWHALSVPRKKKRTQSPSQCDDCSKMILQIFNA